VFRQISAVAAGYVLWSVLWVGFGSVLRSMAILPTADTAVIEGVPPLFVLLAGSILASLVAGYVVAVITRSAAAVPVLILGVLLLATGVFVQMQYWHVMPVWYHVLFLGLLVPVCIVGSRLRSAA
jgi:hypothetical protein